MRLSFWTTCPSHGGDCAAKAMLTIKPSGLTVTIPSNEMSGECLRCVQRLQAGAGHQPYQLGIWSWRVSSGRAHQRDGLSLHDRDQLTPDLVSTFFLFSEMFGRGKWVKVRFHTPGQHTS
jgi:hypothetical protein